MEKKIIALALVLVLMVTAFVGCGQKYKTTNIGGEDVLLATDAEGNTIVNGNQLAVVVTDDNGDIITYENGENQTHYIEIPGSLVIDGVVRGSKFTLNILDGWTSTDYDRIIKDKTDDKCYIQFGETYKLKDNEKFSEIFEATDKANKEMMEVINDEEQLKELIKTDPNLEKYLGGKCTIDMSTGTFTSSAYPCRIYKTKIVDKNGSVVHYAENHYFLVSKTVYCLTYACVDGKGYDNTFDFGGYLRQNFTFIESIDDKV